MAAFAPLIGKNLGIALLTLLSDKFRQAARVKRLKRLSTEAGRSAAQALTGPEIPLRSCAPSPSRSNRLPRSLRVLSAITTPLGSATPCKRAARFGVSPTMPRSTPFGARVLARGTAAVAREQGLKERTVVVEYPNLENATAAYSSAAYAELKGTW